MNGTPDYIPARDGDFNIWINNYSTLITAGPVPYGLTSTQATALAGLTSTWNTAYAAATSGATRGPMSVNAKDVARANVQQYARELAIIIQATTTVTEEQKTALVITVRKTNRTPIPPPTTNPLLNIIAATPLQHTLRYADQLTPDSRSRPFGVAALKLRVEIEPIGTPPTGIAAQTLILTRNPVAVDFLSGNVGKVAYYTGVWINGKGEEGPVSVTTSGVIY